MFAESLQVKGEVMLAPEAEVNAASPSSDRAPTSRAMVSQINASIADRVTTTELSTSLADYVRSEDVATTVTSGDSNPVSGDAVDSFVNSTVSQQLQAYAGSSSLNFSVNDITFYDSSGVADIVLSGSSFVINGFVFPTMAVKAPGSGGSYRPLFAHDVYLTSSGRWVSGTLDAKLDLPSPTFTWPGGVTATELGYISNVTSDVQLQLDAKHPQTAISNAVDETASSATNVSANLITESALVDFVAASPTITTNGVGIVRPMHKMYRRSRSETTNASFSWIHPGVHDLTSGFDVTMDDRLATMACIQAHLTSELGSYLPTADVATTVVAGKTDPATSDAIHNFVVSSLHTQMGTALIEVWYGWTGLGATSFADIISHIGIDSTKFYQFGEDPGAGTFSYYQDYVPAIIFFGPNDTTTLRVRNLSVSEYFLVRWSWTSYAPYTGTYSFRIGSDDGSRLQIRKVTSSSGPTTVCLMDTDQGYATTTGGFAMQAGEAYEFQLFWFEDLGGQRCTLEYLRPGDTHYCVYSPTMPCPDFNYFQPKFSVARLGAGSYTVTFGATCLPHASNYTIVFGIESITTNGAPGTALDDYMIAYHNKSSTSFGVFVKEQDDSSNDGVFRDVTVDFMCVSRGRIFCHGTFNGFTGDVLDQYN